MGSAILGDGTRNYIPLWVKFNYLQSSVIYQDASKNIGVGTTTPAATLDVNGNINAAMTYGIRGSTVVSTAGADNTFLGVGAGHSSAGGYQNTFVGENAGYSGDGSGNVFVGISAGYNNTGHWNEFFGQVAGYNNHGNGNTFLGHGAGYQNTDASQNTFVGYQSGSNTETGHTNTFVGATTGFNNYSGSNNIALGYRAGLSLEGDNNIYIGADLAGVTGESNTIRIGSGLVGQPSEAVYIYGIWGFTASGGVPVYINSNGQLGTSPSALRFKEQVRDMGDSTNALMKLRPVTFFYKPEYDKGERTLQYGLIAEEVAKVYSELVAYDNDGQPYSVRYQYLATMLLNEVQKQYRRAEAEANVIEELEQRLSRLEKLVGNQLQTVAQK